VALRGGKEGRGWGLWRRLEILGRKLIGNWDSSTASLARLIHDAAVGNAKLARRSWNGLGAFELVRSEF